MSKAVEISFATTHFFSGFPSKKDVLFLCFKYSIRVTTTPASIYIYYQFFLSRIHGSRVRIDKWANSIPSYYMVFRVCSRWDFWMKKR